MFGHDLPWWVDTMNVIYLWMLAIGAGAAIAIALTSWFIIKWQGEIQRGKDVEFEKYKLATKVKTDQLEKETADANTRALELKVELAKLRTPRILTPEQQSRIAEKIKPFAVAIAILSVAPIRAGNLVTIRLDENLIKPGGPGTPYLLVFPDYDVKNRVALTFGLDPDVTALIDEYVHDYRPEVVRGSNEPWLFPGGSNNSKDAHLFGIQISARIEKLTGLRMTIHQFRHAAAAIYLKHNPGHYETVRQFLGHRNIRTTINFYCALESIHATRQFRKRLINPEHEDEERRSA
jgi:integrase